MEVGERLKGGRVKIKMINRILDMGDGRCDEAGGERKRVGF
jgi:hypothetical protein